MITYRMFEKTKDFDNIYNLWNKEVVKDDFYMPWDKIDMEKSLFNNEHFLPSLCYVAYDEDNLVGYILGYVRKSDLEVNSGVGYFHSVIVKEEYRRNGIATKLYSLLNEEFIKLNRGRIRCVYMCPGSHSWKIPAYKNHIHPGVPAIPFNKTVYFFLTSVGFYVQGQIDAFHINIEKFSYSSKIKNKLEELNEKGITFDYYNPSIHYGLKELCESLNHRNLEEVVINNIKNGNNKPFLVALDQNKVIGYTGYLYNEVDGRAHLDGVYLSSDYRGLGIGKCMFNVLCQKSHENKATYMSFFTGLENIARYIYISASGKIVQSFAIMAKDLIKE